MKHPALQHKARIDRLTDILSSAKGSLIEAKRREAQASREAIAAANKERELRQRFVALLGLHRSLTECEEYNENGLPSFRYVGDRTEPLTLKEWAEFTGEELL